MSLPPRLLAQVKAAGKPTVVTSDDRGVHRSAVTTPNGPDDPTDPFITAKATALSNDASQIYAFVRDQIKFEGYSGSVRGARGTLWSKAGNTLDKASLLSALLRAAGFTTRYMHTYLYDPTALIHSMFPQTPVLLGCLRGIDFADDPAGGVVNSESHEYYWVQYGPGNIDLDPNIANGQPGQTIQAPDSNFTTIPQNLRQQVTVKINAEIFSQASALFGFGLGTTTVLTQTFDTSALVGNVLSVGNLVQSTSAGGLDISATTFTYTPYILVGTGGPDVTQDTLITGTDFQELYTNFPLGSTVLTGLFVEVDANDDWNNSPVAFTRTLMDRIGAAGRQGNASVQVSLPPAPVPAVTDYDIATINILPSRQSPDSFQMQKTRLGNAYQAYLTIKPALQAVPTAGNLTAAQQAVVQQAVALGKYLAIAENELITMAYNGAADQLAKQLQTGYYMRIYPSAPRLTVAASSLDPNGNAVYRLDVLKNDMRVIGGVGQARKAPYYEEVTRGMIESTIEAQILSQATGLLAVDIGNVFGALGDPNKLTVLGPPAFPTAPDPNALTATTLSLDAQTLILNAVQAGDTVLTPTQMVTLNGITTVGWWETDSHGHTVSHFADGGHQAIGEYAGVQITATKYNQNMAKFIGKVEGIGLTGYAFAAGILEGVSTETSFTGVLKSAKTAVAGVSSGGGADTLATFLKDFNKALDKLDKSLPKADEQGISLIESFGKGLDEGIKLAQDWLKANLQVDPEVFPFLTSPLGPLPAGVTPGNTPGVTAALTVDPTFTVPFNGNELPVYDVTVTNSGPATETFRLDPYDTSGQFFLYPTYPYLTLLPGQVGKINLCALPGDGFGVSLPGVGTNRTFQVTVTGAPSGVSTVGGIDYAMPAIPSLSMSIDPQVLRVPAGGSVSATLSVGSVGNAATGPVTLTLVPDTGINMTGLTSPLTVPLNGVVTVPVSITAGAGTTNGTYYVTVTATYTAAGGTQNVTFAVPVTVAPLGTCALSTAQIAKQAGKTSLGSTLGSLSTDMNSAAGSPANALLVSRVGGDVTVLLRSLDVPFLQAFTATITAAGAAVAQAAPGTLLNALANLDAAICPVGDALKLASTYNGQMSVSPNSQVTGPNLPATYTMVIQNLTASLRVYDFSVTGVPAGVTSQFSVPKITLGPAGSPSYYSNTVTLTLTPGASFTAPFTFNVVATPEGAPSFAITAAGTLLVRPQAISIDNVTTSPTYGPAGTKFAVSARVFAEVNENTQAVLQMTVFNSSGQAVTGLYSSPTVALTTTGGLQNVTIASVDSTNFANGVYTLAVTAYKVENSQTLVGTTGAGSFLVGAPLSGSLTANANSTPPGTAPPGSSPVQVALNITRDTIQNPVSTLVGSVTLNGNSRSMTLYQNGAQQLAYACSDAYVNIVDVTDTANPRVLSAFAHDILTVENGNTVSGFAGVTCAIYQNNLLLSYGRYNGNTTANPIPTHFATFSLANPLQPVQVGAVVDIQRSDSVGLYVAGDTALMYQSTVFYNQFSNFIFQQVGDIWAADLTNSGSTGAVSFLNDVFTCGGLNGNNQCNNVTNVTAASYVNGSCVVSGATPIPNDPTRGGPYRIFQGTAVNGSTSYFGSSDSYGGNILNPTCPTVQGQLLVVDTTAPTAPVITKRVAAPAMTFMTGIAVQGNLAVTVGDSTGVYDILSGYVGTLAISAFDISNPTNPVLLSSVVTQLKDKGGSFIVSLGNNTFAVGNTTNGDKSELVLVDASNPNALRYVPYDATFLSNPTIARNGYFFALSATPASPTNALSVFRLTQISGPQLTVKLQLPKTNGVSVAANSFNIAPSSVTTGTTFDTYQWNQPTLNTISFTMNVTGVNPGDVTTVVTGGEMDYTAPSLGAGKIPLGPLTVLSQQILSISLERQNVNFAGDSSTFVVTVGNPTSSSQTYVPSTLGIPPGWGVTLPASVTVAPGGTQSFNLTLTSALNTVPGVVYKFYVAVNTAGGITASVGGALGVFSPANSGANPDARILTFTASISPSQMTLGIGGSGTFTISGTNTGNYADYLSIQGSPNLPSGWGLSALPNALYVVPGLNNTQHSIGTITVAPFYTNVVPGPYNITIPIQYASTVVNLNLTVNVVGAGSDGNISPFAGVSTDSYTLNLRNTGTAQDTFNLSVVGPLSQVASLAASSGAVAPLTFVSIPITINPVNYLLSGTYPLRIKAVSQGNPLVQTIISANVQVAGTKGVTASINPSPATIQTTPGSVSLLFHANNTGNVNDTYTASITGTTGPASATLGGGAQAFGLPALGSAEFPLNAQITGGGNATVTVKVTSQSDATVRGQTTVTINNGTPGPPTAVASPTQANTPAHRLAILDARGSSDPASLPLTYLWTVTSAPPGSAVNSGSIALANTALAAVRPDLPGDYTFNVHVSNGTASSDASAKYTAVDAVPVAVPGIPFNAATGSFAFLRGDDSYDPDGQPITFAWTLLTKPAGSALTSASIANSQTPRPFFTPDAAGAYQLQLIVSDASAASLPVPVTVTAYSGAVPPNADAGRAQNAALQATVTVNGSASVDPNTSPLALNYQWSLATVPPGSVAALSGATGVSAQFTPDLAGDYVARLVVSNAHGTSQAASTTIHVFFGDVPPNADSGPSQFVQPNGTVTLSAAASADPDNGPLNQAFLWWLDSLPTSSTATLQNPKIATPQFVADKSGYYISRLEATDGLSSGFSNTTIVSAVICDADANGVIAQNDIALIQAALGKAVPANDPRDYNRDGQITSADVTACTNLLSSVAPTLQLSPTSFTENLPQGNSVVTQPIQVSSTGSALSFTVSSDQAWLTSSVTSSSTGSISSLNAVMSLAGLTPATYRGTLTFTPNTGSPQTVSVTLTVTGSGTLSPCDVNQDASTNATDVQLMIDEALGVKPQLHDLNRDGSVNIVDVQLDLNAALNLGCSAQ